MLRTLLLSKRNIGRRTVFAETLLWSLFPILCASTLAHVLPFTALTISTYIAALCLLGAAVYHRSLNELFILRSWKYALGAGVVIDVVYYSLIFWGLTMTSPGNAAIIGLCEVFTTYLLFNTFRGEHMSYTHRVGAVLTVSGSLIVLLNGFTGLNFGDVLIFLSICTAPFGNLLQKKAAEFVHSRTVILMRVLVALPILIALTYLFEPIQEIPMQTPILLALAINGILIAVTRLMWLVSITHLPPAEASALSAAGPLVTILFMWLLLNTPPETVQLVSIPFICVGVYLLSRTEYRRRHR